MATAATKVLEERNVLLPSPSPTSSSSSSSSSSPVLWKHLVAGCGAGIATTVILHPIELVKMRLQAQEASYASASTATHPHAYASSSSSSSSSLPKYRGTFDALRSILRLEGWRGLYAGLVPAVTGSGNVNVKNIYI